MMIDQSVSSSGIPWESTRGSWTTDYNNSLTLIRGPIDDVVDALAGHTERWEREERSFFDSVVTPGRRPCLAAQANLVARRAGPVATTQDASDRLLGQ
jgi:hypothetical protein